MWPSLLSALALVATGLVAGWVNTLAGAGGLLAIPALLFSGLDVHTANGTLRLAIIAQSIVGVIGFRRADMLPWRPLRAILPIVVAGGAAGSWVASELATRALTIIELIVLSAMALGMLVRQSRFLPEPNEAPRAITFPSALALFSAGFYGGLVQAGVGLLLVVALCGLLRFDLIRGNAIKLAATLSFNLASLAIFARAGQVDWRPGVLLAGGMATGALIAVRFAVRRGQEAIRWVIIVAVLAAVTALALREL